MRGGCFDMLYIYTKRPLDNVFVEDVENYFYLKYKDIYKYSITLEIIKEIDKAEVVGSDVLRTRFGTTNLLNISSGSKALLIAITQTNKIVNFIEAGQNIFDKALELSKQYDMHIYMDTNMLFTKYLDYTIVVDNTPVKVFDFVCTQF